FLGIYTFQSQSQSSFFQLVLKSFAVGLKVQKIVGLIIAEHVKKQLTVTLQMFCFNHFIWIPLKNHSADNGNISEFPSSQFRGIQTFLKVVKKIFRRKKIVVNH